MMIFRFSAKMDSLWLGRVDSNSEKRVFGWHSSDGVACMVDL